MIKYVIPNKYHNKILKKLRKRINISEYESYKNELIIYDNLDGNKSILAGIIAFKYDMSKDTDSILSHRDISTIVTKSKSFINVSQVEFPKEPEVVYSINWYFEYQNRSTSRDIIIDIELDGENISHLREEFKDSGADQWKTSSGRYTFKATSIGTSTLIIKMKSQNGQEIKMKNININIDISDGEDFNEI